MGSNMNVPNVAFNLFGRGNRLLFKPTTRMAIGETIGLGTFDSSAQTAILRLKLTAE
jgi:hypothetical protein